MVAGYFLKFLKHKQHKIMKITQSELSQEALSLSRPINARDCIRSCSIAVNDEAIIYFNHVPRLRDEKRANIRRQKVASLQWYLL